MKLTVLTRLFKFLLGGVEGVIQPGITFMNKRYMCILRHIPFVVPFRDRVVVRDFKRKMVFCCSSSNRSIKSSSSISSRNSCNKSYCTRNSKRQSNNNNNGDNSSSSLVSREREAAWPSGLKQNVKLQSHLLKKHQTINAPLE